MQICIVLGKYIAVKCVHNLYFSELNLGLWNLIETFEWLMDIWEVVGKMGILFD